MQVYDGHATKTSVLALNSNCEVLEPLLYYFDDNFNMVNLPIQVIIYPHSSLFILIIPHTYPHYSSYISSCFFILILMYCVSSLSIVGATDVSAQQCHVHDSAVEEDHVPGNDIIMAMMYLYKAETWARVDFLLRIV